MSTRKFAYVFGVVFGAVFIYRSSFYIDGTRYFSLFDDAMISMRYALNFAEGNGLKWNVDEAPIEGISNLLWTLVLASVHLLPVGYEKVCLIVSVIGVFLVLLSVMLTGRITDHLLGEKNTISGNVAAWATALCYPLWYWTLRGMEVGLLTVLSLSAVFFYLRWRIDRRIKNILILSFFLALLPLARDDAVIISTYFAGFLLICHGKHHRRVCMLPIAFILFALAAKQGFRIGYYESFLPNTYSLKVVGNDMSQRLLRGLFSLANSFLWYCFAPIALVFLKGNTGDRQRRAIFLLGPFFLMALYTVYTGGDAWEHFNFPNRHLVWQLPLLFVAVSISIVGKWGQLEGMYKGVLSYIPRGVSKVFIFSNLLYGTGFVVVFALSSFGFFGPYSSFFTTEQFLTVGFTALACLLLGVTCYRIKPGIQGRLLVGCFVCLNSYQFYNWVINNAEFVDYDEQQVQLAHQYKRFIPPNALIGVAWAGTLPYFTPNLYIDLYGKNDEFIATSTPKSKFKPGHNKWDSDYVLGKRRPDLSFSVGDLISRSSSFGYRLLKCQNPFSHQILFRNDSVLLDQEVFKNQFLCSDPKG